MARNGDTDTGARRRHVTISTTITAARRTTLTTATVLTLVGGAACAGSDGDDDAAPAAATVQAAPGASDADQEARTFSGGEAEEAPADVDPAATQVIGQQLAIEAHATMEADDVRAAVDRVSTTVVARGGQVTAAEIDYARATADDDGDGDDTGRADARARLVLAVPPAELTAVRQALEEVGTLLSYDQLAEDVSERLTDLETRIANQRASLERIRELYADATDVDAVVRIEAELTNRETTLEQLLASQQALEDRVAMSTLTIDIATAPTARDAADDGNDTGLGDALAAGWSAFAGGAFALVLALAAALPFVLALLATAVAALWIRQLVRRRDRQRSHPVSSPPEPVSASRPE